MRRLKGEGKRGRGGEGSKVWTVTSLQRALGTFFLNRGGPIFSLSAPNSVIT